MYQCFSPSGVCTFAEAGAGHGGFERDVVFGAVDFFVADDAKAQGVAVVVFQFAPGTKVDFALLDGVVFDALGDVEQLGEVADAAVDFAQFFLVKLVVGVFRAVAEAGGPADNGGDFGAVLAQQVAEFGLEAVVAFGGEQFAGHGQVLVATVANAGILVGKAAVCSMAVFLGCFRAVGALFAVSGGRAPGCFFDGVPEK